ncbi:hypothetical protein R50073_34380 [Maricurvus nonylphenolicus]|uniref:hypothetical protein n=1 Tax=Maricurvus nonylphenolicus TaxID=1008307 RepID=UPI0036F1A494
MMLESAPLLKQEDEVVDPQLELMNRRYRDRLTALTLIRQLNTLISTVQRHRGVTMALLSGGGEVSSDRALPGEVLSEDLQQLQQQVQKRLQFLMQTCIGSDYLLPRVERERILHAWQTICHDWQDDALLDNFELHSHFIEQLLQLMASQARSIRPPLVEEQLGEEVGAGVLSPEAEEQLKLQGFICKKIPEIVEQFAKIRGLATHCAVLGECDKHEIQKLRFWLQCARDLNASMLDTIEALPSAIKRELSSLADLKSYEFKLMFFLNSIERDVLGGDKVVARASDLFELGSEIIDAYVVGVRDGIAFLQRGLDEELERWLEG